MKSTLSLVMGLVLVGGCELKVDGGSVPNARDARAVPEVEGPEDIGLPEDGPEDDGQPEVVSCSPDCPSETMTVLGVFTDLEGYDWQGDGTYLPRRNSNTPYMNDIVNLRLTEDEILFKMADGSHYRAKARHSAYNDALYDGSDNYFWWMTVKNPRWLDQYTAAVDVCVQNVYYCHTVTVVVP